ncbi:orotate phosphoribosyltransferase [Metallosphaera sedula]|uniref:Orotate phosphoribosyltransferase n=3 Tax=Metallosphaera TaxID=41980 RepID=A4YI53_METS5|nr:MULTISPECIES: orotate phosphoribosyltransferase [Metallosphaera]ABP96105.1 orotate phosphoribosyltransferase [Metallosphaera sedula DSM 5348]AKV74915.1 orotate phosphoribosyltransferase [Metallosphaera sedula]AKV77153.1 orotate phosphoribosyltransferase [Metallosphaera sedula]AKV79403.1 orotate phosphoribosyltransferase [Metallosphaera sedula]AKV81648.1 orotate phosphoribosyltransferase [Metallosphaera sedula]
MDIGEVLVKRKLLLIGNFVLTSGKTSPYYIDLRRFPSYPEFRQVVDEAIKKVEKVDFDFIMGVATGGVPLASFLACRMGIPMGYVRVERKGYGTDKLVEGEVTGRKVLVVDDVATTGGSLERASAEIVRSGGKVVGALVIVDREEGASEKLRSLGIDFISVFKISDILRSLSSTLSENERKLIEEYLGGTK